MVHLADRLATNGAERVPLPRPCEWAGCRCDGQFPAPRSRTDPRPYRWFCLEHVRVFNSAWNYYAGMSEAQIEADRRLDTVWQRPTWRVGAVPHAAAFAAGRVHDPFGFFSEPPRPRPPEWDTPEAKAMGVLELSPPVTVAAVKARYKQLVKRHHPDANGGDKGAEERFKAISAAYRIVLDSLTS